MKVQPRGLVVGGRWIFGVLALLFVAGCTNTTDSLSDDVVNPGQQSQGELTDVVISAPSQLQLGESGNLTAFAEYEDGSTQNVTDEVTWLVGDPAVLQVSPGRPRWMWC